MLRFRVYLHMNLSMIQLELYGKQSIPRLYNSYKIILIGWRIIRYIVIPTLFLFIENEFRTNNQNVFKILSV